MKKQTLLSVILSFLLLSSTLFSSINPNSYLEKHNKLSQAVYGLYGRAGGLSTYQLLNLEEPVTLGAMAIPLANIGKAEAVANGVKVGSGVVNADVKLSTEQIQNLNRFTQKVPANSKNSIQLRQTENGNIVFEATSPGKVPGSKAVYQKTVDANGNTVSYDKITYDPSGNIVHNKDKFNVE